MGDGKAREHQEQGSRGKRRRGDTGTRGRGELRDTQISARRSQGFESTWSTWSTWSSSAPPYRNLQPSTR
ncbi:MAG: hypothetical protein BRC40_10255 [Cyanobacteria bacterium QH_8_48_120]|nr:MAG: hypothetical protein BRC40_10255 [Cyanobacteria bacterium QH_8_48_120]